MMPALLDFWFDFASTYSYPAAMRVAPLAWQSGVMVRFRPFLLGPLFKAQGWSTSPFNLYPAKGRYMWRDLERICFDLDSAVSAARTLSTKQLVGCARCVGWIEELMGEEFCRGVFRAQFGDGRQIDDPTIIRDILSQLHIEAAPVLEKPRERKRTKPHCARGPEKRSSSAFLARRLSRQRMVNCSGATIVSNARSLGREWELIQSLPIRDTQGIAYRFEDLKQRALSHKVSRVDLNIVNCGTPALRSVMTVRSSSRPIARVFRATAAPGCRDELLQRFHSSSAALVNSKVGKYRILEPIDALAPEVVFESVWRDLDAVKVAFGDAWPQSHLPEGYSALMTAYSHFLVSESSTTKFDSETAKFPLGVISGHGDKSAECPLCPRKRTLIERVRMSALCRKQTSSSASIDHLVGNCKQA
jgi:2-hydroxychromene-2-carboxylate isomerase